MRLFLFFASSRFIAESCRRWGAMVASMDLFADTDLRQTVAAQCESGAFAGQCQRMHSFSDILQWTPESRWDGALLGGGIENFPELVSHIGRQVKIFGTGPRELQRLHSVETIERLAQMLPQVGGHLPETKHSLAPTDRTETWMVKSLRGSGGTHVRDATPKDRRETDPSSRTPVFHGSLVFQKKVKGTNVAALFCKPAGPLKSALLGITRQLVGVPDFGASPFQYAGSIGPIVLPPFLQERIAQIGQAVATEFGVVGVFGIDLIVDRSTVYLIDINPRIPASAELIEWAHLFQMPEVQAMGEPKVAPCGVNAFSPITQMHVAACQGVALPERTGGSFTCSVRAAPCWGKAILFSNASTPSVLTEPQFRWLEGYHRSHLPPDPDCWISDIPDEGMVIVPGAPIASLFVRGASVKRAEQSLFQFVREVRAGLAIRSD